MHFLIICDRPMLNEVYDLIIAPFITRRSLKAIPRCQQV